MLKLRDAGYQFVIVSNQDGLGSESYPRASFDGPNNLMLQIFASQGIEFRDMLIDCSWPADNAPTRKPGIGLMVPYLQDRSIDWARSAMVGDRITDIQFAHNLNIRGFQLRTDEFGGEWDWPGIAHELADAPRRAVVQRNTKETRIRVELDLDRVAEPKTATGLPFFDHMLEQIGKHGGFALRSAPKAICISMSTTPSKTPALRWVRRYVKRWATSVASAAMASIRKAAPGASPATRRSMASRCRWTKPSQARRWISAAGRISSSTASSSASASATCRPSWCRIFSARSAMRPA